MSKLTNVNAVTETTSNTVAVERKVEKLFWEYAGKDENGNLIIKIPPIEKQIEMQQAVAKAEQRNKRVETTEQSKPSLTECTEFNELIDSLLSTDAVYIEANRMTGRNLRIDYNSKEMKDKAGKTKVGNNIQAKTATVVKIEGAGVL